MEAAKILIVEDDSITARDIQQRLEHFGYNIAAVASSGEAAIKMAAKIQPDLVLMDIVLKGEMDGIEAAEHIRACYDIPVIFLSAFADERTLQRAKVQEPFGYILKPFQETELAISIEMALYKHQMEQKLRENEERYRTIVEDMPALVCRFLPDGVLTFVNEHYCRYFDKTREDLEGQDFFRFIPEGERERVRAHYASLTSENPAITYEHQVLAPDGTLRWQRWTDRALFDEEGNPVEYQSVGVDITERRQAEEALKESEAKFRSLAEQSPNMIFINKRGRVAYANRRCEEVMGYAREEYYAPDFNFLTLIAPECVDGVKASFRRHMAGKEVAPYEYALVTRDGRRIEALVTTKLISYEGESAILGIVTDITERVHVEEALQQYNRNLALLNQVSQALIATLDLPHILERLLRAAVEVADAEDSSVWLWDEDQAGELVCQAILHGGEFSSPRDLRLGPGQGIAGWVAQKGQSAVVADVRNDPRFYPGVDQQIDFRTTSLLAVPLRMRDHIHGVLEVVNKKDGESEGAIAGFTADDRVLVEMLAASAAIAIDNSRLIGALRRYGMELESSNRDLDAFAHTVAHDLKSPLGYMVGYAEVLEQDAATMPAEATRRYLHLIAQNGRRMTNIIDELLLLAGVRKIEQVELVPLDMGTIVSDAQDRLADLILEHQAEILLPDAWPAALGHGPWVEEVWVNYLSNAIKYGGRPPRVELGATEQADGSARFWVRDDGSGLTPEEQARLFKSFERLERVRARGYGLGLSIARRIVEKLGGQVGVESQAGQGSVFSFTLPLAKW